jgi:glycosyltransferase involved in cell wall biosynthesis
MPQPHETPRISVVVATRDRRDRLERLLTSLAEQRGPTAGFEVIVVDDASRDGTSELLRSAERELSFPLKVIAAAGHGPAAARNKGWRTARGSLVAFTDDDCEVTPQWLAEIEQAAAGRPDSIVLGPTFPIVNEWGERGPFSRTREFAELGPWFPTCNIAYPRALLERLNGFDEESFPEPLGEDTDLGWRALELGAEPVFAPRAVVHHAVDDLGALGLLKSALLGSDGVLIFRRHPRLRAETLRWNIIRTPAHVRLAIAVAGVVLARRNRAALILTVPYARELAARCRAANASFAYAPYYAAFDLLHLAGTVRGDLRHGVLVI